MSTIPVLFHYEDEEVGETSVQFNIEQVPRAGEYVTVIFGDSMGKPYNTKLAGTVESVAWEVNSRCTNDRADQIYAHVHFDAMVRAVPWKEG